jgi:pescadillo protein
MKKDAEKANRMKTVFRGMKIFVNREVPLRPVYFTLLCGGAEAVGWERGAEVPGSAGPGSAFASYDKAITHQVVDRPADQIETRPGREYVQPQWVFDSFNTGVALPIAPYAPGRAPPPHLSPFVNDKAEGYVPRQREILDRFAADATGETLPVASGDATQSAPPEKNSFAEFSKELKEEARGVGYSEYKEKLQKAAAENMARASAGLEAELPETKGDVTEGGPPTKPPPTPTEAEEERLRQKALMPKKHRRLLQRIEKGEAMRADEGERLRKKRKKLESKMK